MVKKVGIYQLQEKIGSGNHGVVYSGVNTLTGDKIAAKSVPIKNLNGKLLQQMECEIKVLKNLESPFIIRLFDVLKTSNNVYLITEFCAGGDLEQAVKTRSGLNEALAKKWLSQLVEAFITLQQHHIMHRDLKLANILLTEDSPQGNIKVADFGFARFLNENSAAITQLGTPLFMAPEIFNSEHYSFKADVWSLGVLSYEMLVGAPVFVCKTLAELRKLQSAPIEFSGSGLSKEAQDFVRSMLKYNHSERPDFQQLKAHPFLWEYYGPPAGGIPASPEIEMDENTDESEFIDLGGDSGEEESLYEGPSPLKGTQDLGNFSRKVIDLDFQVTQIEDALNCHVDLLRKNKTRAALCVVYYAKTMFRKYFDRATSIGNDSQLTRSQDQFFSELFEKIQVNYLSTDALYEGLLKEHAMQDPTVDALVDSLLGEIRSGLVVSTNPLSSKKIILQLLGGITDLDPGNRGAQELFNEANEDFRLTHRSRLAG